MKNKINKISQYGSMMVEALAMLGLITMITPVLYKKAAERTTELQDINTASQMRTLSKALDDFIMDNYEEISAEDEGEMLIAKEDIVPYLPYNFNVDKSKLFDEFQFALRNDIVNAGTDKEHSAITGMVLAPSLGTGNLPMIRASKIASMVGANGGIVDKTKGTNIQGVQGAWQANLEDFGFSDDAENGSLVVSSIHAVTSSGGGGSEAVVADNVLFRDASKGPEYNTMMTTLYMNNNDIDGVNSITAKASEGGATGDEVVNIGPNLAVSGNVSAGADISAGGALTVGTDATITGALESGTAKVGEILKVGLTGEDPVSIAGATKIAGKTTIEGNVNVSGQGSFVGGVVADGAANETNPDGTEGSAYSDDDNSDYSLVSVGNMLVQANAHVVGDVRVDADLIAENLFGYGVLGGGYIEDEDLYNFTASSSSVAIQKPSFSVASDRLGVSENESYMSYGGEGGARISAGDPDGNVVAKMSAGNADLTVSDGVITSTTVDADNNTAEIKMQGAVTTLTNKSADESYVKEILTNPALTSLSTKLNGKVGSSVYVTPVAIGLSTNSYDGDNRIGGNTVSLATNGMTLAHEKTGTIASSVELTEGNVSLTSKGKLGDLLVDTKNITVDQDAILFNGEDFVIAEDPSVPAEGSEYSNRTAGVRINRTGIIQLPASSGTRGNINRADLGVDDGFQDVPGYIKLDRIIANQAYPAWLGSGEYDTGASKPYDAYQLNPAYTSVMHDIKLTTRGGARLSDILPDFINKGIYVLDNTYEEDKDRAEWNTYIVNVGNQITIKNGPDECAPNDMDCIASPWLGFVPAPQCPPGYSKVITINPIRWKMSEAFYIPTGVTPTATNIGKKFREYFVQRTNPLNAGFQLSNASGENHTHVATSGWPLTFQTNTWLNTTISGVYGSRGADNTAEDSTGTNQGRDFGFIGWHAIMGFLYNGSDYEEYLGAVGQNAADFEDKIVWNLFPVYNQEMTAIANVYCYFERRSMSDPDWEWNTNYVDNYDQISNFRLGFERDNDYSDRLNDPALGYDEVW
ncbi:MAG: hypothetical protein E7019_00055 [Alphaproteobacteria bacterium]|nr:hypothetical protein [Alphaproteobacteria bacterium]